MILGEPSRKQLHAMKQMTTMIQMVKEKLMISLTRSKMSLPREGGRTMTAWFNTKSYTHQRSPSMSLPREGGRRMTALFNTTSYTHQRSPSTLHLR